MRLLLVIVRLCLWVDLPVLGKGRMRLLKDLQVVGTGNLILIPGYAICFLEPGFADEIDTEVDDIILITQRETPYSYWIIYFNVCPIY